MSEMIECVARAMFDETNEHDTTWETEAQEIKSTYLIMAQAAIEAMREPTGAMREECSGWNASESDMLGCFQAMIDAALR